MFSIRSSHMPFSQVERNMANLDRKGIIRKIPPHNHHPHCVLKLFLSDILVSIRKRWWPKRVRWTAGPRCEMIFCAWRTWLCSTTPLLGKYTEQLKSLMFQLLDSFKLKQVIPLSLSFLAIWCQGGRSTLCLDSRCWQRHHLLGLLESRTYMKRWCPILYW